MPTPQDDFEDDWADPETYEFEGFEDGSAEPFDSEQWR